MTCVSEIKRWWAITLWMIGVCAVTRVYQMMDENHGKRPEFIPYQHLRIRKKVLSYQRKGMTFPLTPTHFFVQQIPLHPKALIEPG